jgi:hypothetical protein
MAEAVTLHAVVRLNTSGGRALGAPSGVLEDYPIAVRILKGLPLDLPIGIERLHRLVPRLSQSLHGFGPSPSIRQIEDQQIVLGRGGSGPMPHYE